MQLSIEIVRSNIDIFKEKTLELATRAVTDNNARYLEPRELKTYTDIVINIEDSLKNNTNEGETARKITRLLNKYSSDDNNIDNNIANDSNNTAPLVIEGTLVNG